MTIEALILDVDGTLTDGHIYIGNNGEIMKAFYAHDAVGVREIVKSGIIPIIITGRDSNIIRIRAEEMNIKEVYTGVMDKKKTLLDVAKEKQIELRNIAFMGDDLNDLEAMRICGHVACPKNAVEEVKRISDFVSKYNGGYGAVREYCNYILRGDE